MTTIKKLSSIKLLSFLNFWSEINISIFIFILFQNVAFGQTVTIKGVLNVSKPTTLTFSFPEDPIKSYIQVSEATTNKYGAFTTTFKLKEKKAIRIEYTITDKQNNPQPCANYLWLEPNKTIEAIWKDDSIISYRGHCLQENYLLNETGLSGLLNFETNDSDFISFSKLIDSKKMWRLNKLSAASKKYKFSKAYLDYIKVEIFYYNYRHKFQFIYNYPTTPFSTFTSFLNAVNVFSDKCFNSLKFRNGLRDYVNIIASNNKQDTLSSYLLNTFRTIDAKLKNHTKTKEFLKTYILNNSIAYEQNIDTLNEALASIVFDNNKFKNLNYFNKLIGKKMALLYANKKIPDIILKDINGENISLKKYEGKILLIDFWGAWCKPCMDEMPFSKKLHYELDTSKIKFIYINNPADSDEKWKTTIKNLNLEGIHLKADEETQKKLSDFYVFSKYPFYVIHNRNGTPINIEGGIRPSTNAKQLLTTLIQNEAKN